MRSPDLKRAALRVSAARALLLLGFAALAARSAHLAVVDERGARRGRYQRLTELRIPAERGLIVDRHGAELAVSIDAPSVYAVPPAMADREAAGRALASALDLERGRLVRTLAEHEGFVFVARWVTPERARRVLRLGLAGVGVVEEPRRVYPHRELAGHVLGFANIDGRGVRGIEQQEDAWLRGEARAYPVERDARGRLLAVPGLDPGLASGGDVRLTLDAALQADAEAALDEAIAESGAQGGMVLTLDPRTADVLALAERPGFDPNRFRRVDYASTRSRAFLDALEPGSTLKIFLAAAALEHGSVRPEQRIDCEQGRFAMPGKTIRDTHPHGMLDLRGVLRVSSNICAAKIAFRLGGPPYEQTLRAFGFGRPTGSGFPSESSGLLRPAETWRSVDLATIAFGHGLNVTPIQLAAATAALANGGVWSRPRLVLARRRGALARGRDAAHWERAPAGPTRRAVSRETARAVLDMMEDVVSSEGTGRLARLRGLRAAGKTGTAQLFDADTGSYSTDRYLAWFVGVVPAEDPRLVILTELDEPSRGHSGGATAAPLFASVAAAQLARLGVRTAPDPAPRVRIAGRKPPPVAGDARDGAAPARAPENPAPLPPRSTEPRPARAHGRVFLPDFLGLTVDEVLARAAREELRVEVHGEGRAVDQDPVPGTVLARHARVSIRFRRDGD